MKKLIMAIVSILFAIGLTACGNNIKFNLNDYVETSFKGLDGDIDLTVKINWADMEDVLLTEYQKRFSEDEAMLNTMGTSFVIQDCVEMEVSERTGLSVGDNVNVVFSVDEKRLEEYGIKMDYENFMIEVEEPDWIVLDPFENITVSFEGIGPSAQVIFSYERVNDLIDYVNFESETYRVNIGDVVTITATPKRRPFDNSGAIPMVEHGYKMLQSEKQYEVTNIDYYMCKAENINEETLPILKEKSEEVLHGYFERTSEYISYDNLQYEGYELYFHDNHKYYSVLIMLYSADITSIHEQGSFDVAKVYFPVQFVNVVCRNDGTYGLDEVEGEILGFSDYIMNLFSVVRGCNDFEDYLDNIEYNYGAHECIISDIKNITQ